MPPSEMENQTISIGKTRLLFTGQSYDSILDKTFLGGMKVTVFSFQQLQYNIPSALVTKNAELFFFVIRSLQNPLSNL